MHSQSAIATVHATAGARGMHSDMCGTRNTDVGRVLKCRVAGDFRGRKPSRFGTKR